MFLDTSLISGIAAALVKAWSRGEPRSRVIIGIALGSLVIGVLFIVASENRLIPYQIGNFLAYVFIVPAGVSVVALGLYESGRKVSESQNEIREAEARFRQSPDKPTTAWELASLKLESYINRNLSQIRWIFFLIVMIMGGGFIIIGSGIWKVYQDPQSLGPSIVAATSGIVVQFIGATFLIIYRTTVAQAREYVTMLERINAVGMSVQILENIDPERHELRDQARVDIAKNLLEIYRAADSRSSKAKKTHRDRGSRGQ